MSRSRRCCCCLNVVDVTSARLEPPHGRSVPWTFGTFFPGFLGLGSHLDAKLNVAYMLVTRTSPATTQMWRLDYETRVPSLVMSRSGSSDQTLYGSGVCCSPREEKVAYVRAPVGGGRHTANVVNYDGTGDTELFTFPAIGVLFAPQTLVNTRRMACDHAQGLFFVGVNTPYVIASPLSTVSSNRIYSFTSGAASPTVVYDSLAASVSALDRIQVLDFNRQNGKLYFLESRGASFATATIEIKRCDADGGNLEMLVNLQAEGHRLSYARWSYQDECFYSYDFQTDDLTTDHLAGFHRRNVDFVKQERFWYRTTNVATPALGFDLGCGFEKLGPTYKGF